MRQLIYILLMVVLFACKKKTTPDPIPGKVIAKYTPGTYSGYLSSKLNIHHEPGNLNDSSIYSQVAVYENPVVVTGAPSSVINSVDVNTHPLSKTNNFYYADLFGEDISSSFLAEYRSLNYSINSSKLGMITFSDNRPFPSYSNHNSIPLNFSKSAGYSLTLNGLSNCTGIEVRVGVNMAYRITSPLNPSFKIHESELLDVVVGDKTVLYVVLRQSKDTVINGRKFQINKEVEQSYILTFTN